MLDEPIEDVTPARAAMPLQSFDLRRRPAYGQLVRWAAWSRKMGQNRKSPTPEIQEENPANEGELIDKTV
jgi:hypothetical protein